LVRLIERAEQDWLARSARLPLIRRSKPWSSPTPCRRTRDSNRRSPAMDKALWDCTVSAGRFHRFVAERTGLS